MAANLQVNEQEQITDDDDDELHHWVDPNEYPFAYCGKDLTNATWVSPEQAVNNLCPVCEMEAFLDDLDAG